MSLSTLNGRDSYVDGKQMILYSLAGFNHKLGNFSKRISLFVHSQKDLGYE